MAPVTNLNFLNSCFIITDKSLVTYLLLCTIHNLLWLYLVNTVAVAVEYRMIMWIAKLTGVQGESATGVLTESIDISNVLALAAARQCFLENATFPRDM